MVDYLISADRNADQGYTRSFGMRLPSGERREWLKPIMFSAGIGQVISKQTSYYFKHVCNVEDVKVLLSDVFDVKYPGLWGFRTISDLYTTSNAD